MSTDSRRLPPFSTKYLANRSVFQVAKLSSRVVSPARFDNLDPVQTRHAYVYVAASRNHPRSTTHDAHTCAWRSLFGDTEPEEARVTEHVEHHADRDVGLSFFRSSPLWQLDVSSGQLIEESTRQQWHGHRRPSRDDADWPIERGARSIDTLRGGYDTIRTTRQGGTAWG